jgi:hypothetical protein
VSGVSCDGQGQTGASGGGFDALRLAAAAGEPPAGGVADLSIPLDRRPDGPHITIPIPIYGGGMSFGSVSLQVMLGRAMAS